MSDPQNPRIKRLYMRSIRRGIKEMDIILGTFAQTQLANLCDNDLDLYETLLTENDHDLYAWVSKSAPTPAPYNDIIAKISAHALR